MTHYKYFAGFLLPLPLNTGSIKGQFQFQFYNTAQGVWLHFKIIFRRPDMGYLFYSRTTNSAHQSSHTASIPIVPRCSINCQVHPLNSRFFTLGFFAISFLRLFHIKKPYKTANNFLIIEKDYFTKNSPFLFSYFLDFTIFFT